MDSLKLLIDGFGDALTPTNLLLALIGVTIGTAVGVLPGHRPGAHRGAAAADHVHASSRPAR